MQFLESVQDNMRTNTNYDIITYIEFLNPTMLISSKFIIFITYSNLSLNFNMQLMVMLGKIFDKFRNTGHGEDVQDQ